MIGQISLAWAAVAVLGITLVAAVVAVAILFDNERNPRDGQDIDPLGPWW